MTTEERIEAMFQRTEEIHAHLVGTMDRRGLTSAPSAPPEYRKYPLATR